MSFVKIVSVTHFIQGHKKQYTRTFHISWRIWVKFGTGYVLVISSNLSEFREHRFSQHHSLFIGINKLLRVLYICHLTWKTISKRYIHKIKDWLWVSWKLTQWKQYFTYWHETNFYSYFPRLSYSAETRYKKSRHKAIYNLSVPWNSVERISYFA